MNKKKILILGSGGQLGNYLFKNLKKIKKYQIVSSQSLNVRLINIKKDIKKILKIKPHCIINCSGYTNVPMAEKNKKKAIDLNCNKLLYLAKFCKKYKIKIIHFSTDYVFPGKNKLYNISDMTKPINFYGYTKLRGEELLKKSGCKYLIFRISWLISGHKSSFLMKIKNRITEHKNVDVINDAFSSITSVKLIYTFFRINLDQLVDYKISGLYHLRNNNIVSYFTVAKFIESLLGRKYKNSVKKIKFRNYKSTVKIPKFSKLNIIKTKRTFIIPGNKWRDDIKFIHENKN
tara:strand:+ start:4881 stop:5750 length:870 start_codon:yes stop_codon:yes gene_type:complete